MHRSNCLIEALKAKLKDPLNVKIISPKKEWNGGYRHFYWVKKDKVFHYEAKDENTSFLFQGRLKEQSMSTFESFWLRKLAITKPKLDKVEVAKRMQFPSVKLPGMVMWTTYCPKSNQFNLPKKNRLTSHIMVVCNNEDIKVMKIADFHKEDYTCVYWKYLSPYCQEFRIFRNSILN